MAWWCSPRALGGLGMLLLVAVVLLGVWYHRQRAMSAHGKGLVPGRIRERGLKLALWDIGDTFWDWDLRQDRIYRIGTDHVRHVAVEDSSTTDRWWQGVIHPEDLPRVRHQMQTCLEGGSAGFESEHRIRDIDGTWVWVCARGQVIEYGPQARPVRMVGTVRNITRDRRIEHERHVATEVLRSLNEAVALLDSRERLVSVNPAFLRMTGYRGRDLEGLGWQVLRSRRHPRDFYRRMRRLLGSDGQFTGELWLRRADGEEFLAGLELVTVRDESGHSNHCIAVLSDVTEKKRTEQELRHLANYDTLTGLPSRALLSERLVRAVLQARFRRGRVALMLLDLDHFKTINDALGHALGDDILKVVAQRLLKVLGGANAVARMGGDEFILMLEDFEDRAELDARIESVIEAFREPIPTGDKGSVVVSLSIGVALYPEHAQNPSDLLKFADVAMYRAKELGRNIFLYYEPELDAGLHRRAVMLAALRNALSKGELRLEYQPRQSLLDGRIVGVEALLRWNNAELGEVPPATFIPLAEAIGLIQPIGEWVLREACQCLQRWREQGIDGISMAVNISALQLLRGNLPESVQAALEASGLPSGLLELELTESVLMGRAERAVVLLKDLKLLGVRILLDDFGTGYSSLAYLRHLPLDALKIDKTFIAELTHDPGDAAISESIIVLAHKLGLEVIAEGVETAEQQACLLRYGCDQVQGYWLARPMSADACLEFLRQPRASAPSPGLMG